jgi:hypothetical protein
MTAPKDVIEEVDEIRGEKSISNSNRLQSKTELSKV